MLDLSIAPGETVLEQWLRVLSGVSAPIRVVHGPQIPAPAVPASRSEMIETIRERDAYRGPAGAIRDVTGDLHPDAWALVIEATRYYSGSIDAVLAAISRDDVDVLVTCNADRTPAGVYAMRRSVLDHVASVGYVDLKEQLLARARAAGDRVRVVEQPDGVSFPLRTRAELLRAASMSGGERGTDRHGSARVLTGERWASVVAADASIDASAVIVESVVMPGARVEANTVVARSIVCPGAHVAADSVVLDQTVRAETPHRKDLHAPGDDRRRLRINARMPSVRLGWRPDRQQGTAT
ncbi:MAG: hypothetical protein RIB60_08550 [Phycisphaerales bacterium]